MGGIQNLQVTNALNGKRVAFGTFTPTTADEDVVTGLAIVEGGVASLAAPPILTHDRSIANVSSTVGTLRIRSYKPTDATLTTPVPSTGTEVAVSWFAWVRDA